jgi:gamma-tubulin complex component 5
LPSGFVRRSKEEEEKRKKPGFYDREKESQRLDWDSRWSTPSLSPLNSGDLALDEDTDEDGDVIVDLDNRSDPVTEQQDGPSFGSVEGKSAYRLPPHTYEHRKQFEALQRKQYWREGWRGDGTVEKRVFSIGDASTLGRPRFHLPFFCASDMFSHPGPSLRTILRPPSEKTRSTDINIDFLLQHEVRFIKCNFGALNL